MNPNVRNGFVAATTIHLIFVGILLFFAFWNPQRESPPEPFENLPPPSQALPEPELPAEPEPEPVVFEFEPEPIPEPPPRPPRPDPPPQPQPPPPPPPEPPPPPRPAPAPEPPPQRVRYDEFRRENPEPVRQPRPAPPPQREIEVPDIDYRAITRALRETTLDQETRERIERQTPVDQNRMAEYFARLLQQVRGAWQQPPGLPAGMAVRVQFNLSADGRITNPRIVESSGHSGFDQSVLEAFRRLGSTSPPPDRQAYAPSLRFTVE